MKKEVISFRKNIAAGITEILSERVKWRGYVSEIRVRFYPGVERDLHVRPYVLHTVQQGEDLVTYVGNTEKYLSGDNDYFVFPVRVPVDVDDEVKVWVKNVETSYMYTLSVDIVMAYEPEGGLQRG